MMPEARYKPADGVSGVLFTASCGRRDILTGFCPGKVAQVGRQGEAWVAKPPVGLLWRKKAGIFEPERSHLPNRHDPEPSRRFLPRVSGGHGPASALISGMTLLSHPNAAYPSLPLVTACDRGHPNHLAVPAEPLLSSL